MNMDTHTIPDDTAAHYERLITEAEKMRQAGADALKAAYADLRADLKQLGWAGASISAEVAAFKGAIAEMALAEADKTKRDEKGERIDDYVSLLTRARARGQRRNDERLDPITGEFVDDNEASDGSPSVSSSLTTREPEESVVSNNPKTADETHERPSTNDEPSPEAGPQAEASPAGTGAGTLADREGRHDGEAVEADLPTHSEKTTVATQGEATEPTSDDGEATGTYAGEDRAAANAGGDHVDCNALRVPTSVPGEGAANTALPADGIVMEYVPPTGMKRLPFASCFPDHSKAEYERLEKDIAASRVRQPIIRQGNVIIDGFARYTIARKYGFAYPVQEYTGNDLPLDVIELQRVSRNFTPAQEKKIAADLAKEFPHRADEIMAAFGLTEALEAAE